MKCFRRLAAPSLGAIILEKSAAFTWVNTVL